MLEVGGEGGGALPEVVALGEEGMVSGGVFLVGWGDWG